MTAYVYDAADRLTEVHFDSGAATYREYDAANRLTEIRHEDDSEGILAEVEYEWNVDNTVDYRTEYDCITGSTGVVTFAYDHRKRLTGEVRVQDGDPVYDLAYAYDAMGNRTVKADAVAERRTEYVYDVDVDPETLDFPTRHNRLLSYELFDTSGESDVLLRTVRYTYFATGNASNISVKDEYLDAETTPGDPNDYELWHDLGLFYYTNGQLWRAQWSTFALAEGRVAEDSHRVVATREFRYDDPTERYMTADFSGGVADPNNAASGGPAFELEWPVGWTDYLGGPSGDGVVDFNGNPASPVWTFESQTAYMLSLYGEIDSSSGDATYYHGDMIGSTMLTSRLESDPPGQESVEAVSAVAYTAFGETVTLTGMPDPNDANATTWTASIGGELPDGFPRYAYAGQHGYESGLLSRTGANPNLPPVTLQHLGWRWYDPSLGRFVQRDPIGIAGGMNVYAYVANSPTASTDPQGLYHWDGLDPPWGYPKFGVQTHVASLPTLPGSASVACWVIDLHVPKKGALGRKAAGWTNQTAWYANALTRSWGNRAAATVRVGTKSLSRYFGPMWDCLTLASWIVEADEVAAHPQVIMD